MPRGPSRSPSTALTAPPMPPATGPSTRCTRRSTRRCSRPSGGTRCSPSTRSRRYRPAGEGFGSSIDWTEVAAGGNAIDTYGVAIRPEDVVQCGEAEAVLLGAVGGPKWDDPSAAVRPEQALFALRGGLGLFANLRPVTVHPALVASSPLRPELLDGVDLLIVRELTGGIYFGKPSDEWMGDRGRQAIDTLPYDETEI